MSDALTGAWRVSRVSAAGRAVCLSRRRICLCTGRCAGFLLFACLVFSCRVFGFLLRVC